MPTQYKVNQLAKDLGMKSKDLADVVEGKNVEIKTQKSLETWEFDVLFELLTRGNQVKDIDRYIDGETAIPSKLAPKPAPKSAEKSEAKEAKTEGAVKPAEKAKTEPKVDEAKAEVKAEPKTESKAEVKAEPAEAKSETKPAQTQPQQPKKQPIFDQNALNKQRMQAQLNGEKITPIPVKQPTQPVQQPRRDTNNNTNRDNRPARPAQNTQQNTQYAQNAQQRRPMPGQAPAQGQYNDRRPQNNGQYAQSAQQNGQRFDQRFDRKPPMPGQQSPKPDFKKPMGGQGQFGNRDNRGGAGMFDKDKGDRMPSMPRETFKPQAFDRGQTPKGTESQGKQRGATRIVDTRTTDIDLSKYDEKLDTFVSDGVTDSLGARTKKPANVQRQQQDNPASTKSARQTQQKPMQKPQPKQFGKGQKKQAPAAPVKKMPVNVQIPDEITVSELAMRLKVTAGEVVKHLMMMGVMATLNQVIDFDTAALVADELGAVVTKEVVVTIEEKLFGGEEEDSKDDLVERAPVVCVMGHVDHGKTSLLDAIRNTRVTTGEAGGITQHIGAYRVKLGDREITFLDTPGHEAFTAMRARGAQATDIAILVVAADDGIMPQTVEAINHAKAAGIDIIVAINKMDKPTANPDAIKNELTKYDLVPEEWGGDVMCVPVSALTHAGIDELLEDVLLVADVKELKANPNRRAKGLVIESKLDKGRGPVATILVQNGTLHPGDTVIAGTCVGRVRTMTDHTGRNLKAAGPSVPVEITGLDAVPTAGDEFNAVEDERMAKELADRRRAKAKEAEFKANARANLETLFARIEEGSKTLSVIVKADVDGSVEAVKASLEKISNDEVKVSVIHAAVGGITENDVMFAAASDAIIVGFNVRPDRQALDSAERQGVQIRTYRVIYECIDEITAAMKGMLAPKFREQLLGRIEVRQIFKISKVGTICGSYVLDGKVTRTASVRVVREGIVVAEDSVASLRREKDDVKEVAAGYECGIALDRFKDIKIGDILEAFTMEEIQQ